MALGLGLGLPVIRSGTNLNIDNAVFASVQNLGPTTRANSTGNDTLLTYYEHILGADMDALCIGEQGWYTSNTSEPNVGNDYTIIKAAVIANGVSVPMTFGGQRLRVVADGETKVTSDLKPASAWGSSGLSRGDSVWVKIERQVTAGGYIPKSGQRVSDVTGAQAAWLDSSTITYSDTDETGQYTFSNGTPSSSSDASVPFLLGIPSSTDTLVYFGVGDSIFVGFSDNVAKGAYGRGMFQLAMQDGNNANPVPSFLIARSGYGTAPFVGSNPKWKQWAQHCNRAVDELQTNNIDNQAVSLMQSNSQNIWNNMYDAGIEKIIRTQLMARTNSTDDWQTTTNQTPINANWDTGGRVEQMNTWFAAQEGISHDLYAKMDTVLDESNPTLWRVNGTADFMTTDGTHPYDDGVNAIGNTLAARSLRLARLFLDNNLQVTDFPQAYAWLDASDESTIVDNGSSVTWSDKINSYNASRTNSNRPETGTRTIQNKNVFDMVAANSEYFDWSMDNNIPSGPNSYMVVRYHDTPDDQGWPICGLVGGSPNWGYDIGKFSSFWYMRGFNGASVQNNSAPNSLEVHVDTYRRRGSYHEVISDNNTRNSGTNAADATMTNGFLIGRESSGNYFDGAMCEIVVFDDYIYESEIEYLRSTLLVKWKAPSITSLNALTIKDNVALSHLLTSNQDVTWSIVGGADSAFFTIDGANLNMEAKDFANPSDSNTNNDYEVTVRATNVKGNTTDQNITVAVTEQIPWVMDVDYLDTDHTASEGDTRLTNSGGSDDYKSWVPTVQRVPAAYTGKVYWEMHYLAGPVSTNSYVSIVTMAAIAKGPSVGSNPIEDGSSGRRGNGEIWASTTGGGSRQVSGLQTFGNGDVVMMCFNPSTGELWTGVNGVWDDDPVTDPATFTVYTTGQTEWALSLQTRDTGTSCKLVTLLTDMTYALPPGTVSVSEL